MDDGEWSPTRTLEVRSHPADAKNQVRYSGVCT